MWKAVRFAVAIAMIVAVSLIQAHQFKVSDVEFIQPWTRDPGHGVKDVPVYILHNAGRADRIVAVSSPFPTKGEMRIGKDEGGRRLTAIDVAAGATTELTAETQHLLLIGLPQPLEGYQYFPLILTFERAGNVEIEVYVEETN